MVPGGGHSAGDQGSGTRRKDWRRQENRRGSARRGGRRRGRGRDEEPREAPAGAPERPQGAAHDAQRPAPAAPEARNGQQPAPAGAPGERRERRGRRRGRGGDRGDRQQRFGQNGAAAGTAPRPAHEQRNGKHAVRAEEASAVGMLLLESQGGAGFLRQEEFDFLPRKEDVHVPLRLVQRYKLREGAMITGKVGPGHGKYKASLHDVELVDGKPPAFYANKPLFKNLTSIDPDFHYAVGDASNDVSLRILDIICPVGRGTRGLIVAPPRSGKTILMQKFAHAIETIYPDVHLMVLLVDERPEEATEWKRSTKGHVFVSTNDEPATRHVKLAEAVWKRCQRLVELGEDVVLMLDSITRLARAYNNTAGAGTGRTMSGGLDSRAMERPKQFFGSARNSENAGSLTILGTTLVETGSRMDQVIFEEFKGTGNMEIVLSRKLADRRIFPAIDIERSGTRKEEKLISSHRLRQINTLRRVLARMHFTEAMELLITKLEDVEKTDDFLKRFEVDPDA